MSTKQSCPGQLQWSAFGAPYMDTMCATAMTFDKADFTPGPYLQDLDSEYYTEDVPCPFCATVLFLDYCGIGQEKELAWSKDREPATGVDPYPVDGRSLTFYAVHPERGIEQLILIDTLGHE